MNTSRDATRELHQSLLPEWLKAILDAFGPDDGVIFDDDAWRTIHARLSQIYAAIRVPSAEARISEAEAAQLLDDGFSIKVLNPERGTYWRCPHCDMADYDGHEQSCIIRTLVERLLSRVVPFGTITSSTAAVASGETPRTDEQVRLCNGQRIELIGCGQDGGMGFVDAVTADFARCLESELTDANARHERSDERWMALGAEYERKLKALSSSIGGNKPPDGGAFDGEAHGLTARLKLAKYFEKYEVMVVLPGADSWFTEDERRIIAEALRVAPSATRAPLHIIENIRRQIEQITKSVEEEGGYEAIILTKTEAQQLLDAFTSTGAK